MGEGEEKWQVRQVTFPECLGVPSWTTKKKKAKLTTNGVLLHGALLNSFKPGPSTKGILYASCEISQTLVKYLTIQPCYVYPFQTIPCWGLVSEKRLCGECKWEEQELVVKERNSFTEAPKFLWFLFVPRHTEVTPWQVEQRVLSKHCLNEEMIYFPSSGVSENCWRSQLVSLGTSKGWFVCSHLFFCMISRTVYSKCTDILGLSCAINRHQNCCLQVLKHWWVLHYL